MVPGMTKTHNSYILSWLIAPVGWLFLVPVLSFASSATSRAVASEDLTRKLVTVHLKAGCLAEILRAASLSSHVQMRPTSEVSEIRMSVFVNRITVRDLQSSLADVLH